MSLITITEGDEFRLKKRSVLGTDPELQKKVSLIIKEVIKTGDQALFHYTKKFDNVELSSLRVSRSEIKAAGVAVDSETRQILTNAITNVRDFHQNQCQKSWKKKFADGTCLGELVKPVDRAGIYIPGGKAFYPSTMIMNTIPAQLAEVPSLAVVSPPGRDGLPHPLVLGLCSILGIDEVYNVGGAQAIAALAYGTESIAPVCVITGPGNRFVAEAKREVFGRVGIDSIAGPSEILILHDDPEVPIEYLVRDLISQAEHDESAQSILITTSRDTAKAIQKRLDELVPTLPRRNIIQTSLKNNGQIIVVNKIEEGIAISNKIAPEHLELLLRDENRLGQISNAGAIFVGRWSSEPVGDYYAGPNHTIPTNGSARYASPLSVRNFQKHSSLIHYSKQRLWKQGTEIAAFADLEELNGHAEAIRERLKSKENNGT